MLPLIKALLTLISNYRYIFFYTVITPYLITSPCNKITSPIEIKSLKIDINGLKTDIKTQKLVLTCHNHPSLSSINFFMPRRLMYAYSLAASDQRHPLAYLTKLLLNDSDLCSARVFSNRVANSFRQAQSDTPSE